MDKVLQYLRDTVRVMRSIYRLKKTWTGSVSSSVRDDALCGGEREREVPGCGDWCRYRLWCTCGQGGPTSLSQVLVPSRLRR